MKFWNLTARTKEDGSKVLDVTLYGDIDGGFFADGVASSEIARQLAEHKDAKEIEQRINSRGGDVFGGLAIYNALQNHGAKVHSIVEGLAGSAASVAAMAGRTSMSPGAMMMIHNPWTIAVGDAANLRQTADVLDAVRDSLVSVYAAKTGKKPAELRSMLNAETWMSAEQAKKEGFASDIIGERVKAKAEGESVILNAVPFLSAGLPAPILALATELPKVEPVEPAPRAITREILATEAPDLLLALIEEGVTAGSKVGHDRGHVAGVSEERARLKAIDDLDVRGHADLVHAAKYGESPIDAPTLAMAVLKADRAAGAAHLAQRREETRPLAEVKPGSPEQNDKAAQEREAAKQIAAHVNANRR